MGNETSAEGKGEHYCSFTTRYHFMDQPAYRCNTCPSLNSTHTFCSFCAKNCHAGHNIVSLGTVSCFCDCGDPLHPLHLNHKGGKELYYFNPGRSPYNRWNIRNGPSLNSSVLASIEPGEAVEVLETGHPGGFLKVKYREIEGWTAVRYESWTGMMPFKGPRAVIYFSIESQGSIYLLRLGTNSYTLWDRSGEERGHPQKTVFNWKDGVTLIVDDVQTWRILKEWVLPFPNGSDHDIDKAILRSGHGCDDCGKNASRMGILKFGRFSDYCWKHVDEGAKKYLNSFQPIIWKHHQSTFLKPSVSNTPQKGLITSTSVPKIPETGTSSTTFQPQSLNQSLISNPYQLSQQGSISTPTSTLITPIMVQYPPQTPIYPQASSLQQSQQTPSSTPTPTMTHAHAYPLYQVISPYPQPLTSSQNQPSQPNQLNTSNPQIQYQPYPPPYQPVHLATKSVLSSSQNQIQTRDPIVRQYSQNTKPTTPINAISINQPDSSETNKKKSHFERIIAVEGELVMLSPIVGLNEIPLLNLMDSVKNLPVKDIEKFSWVAIKSMEMITLPPGISLDEAAALNLYTREWTNQTDSLYYLLNSYLRKENRNQIKPFFPYLKLLLKVLEVLPKYKGVIWRGLTGNLASKYQKDKELFWWACSSCTTNMEALSGFLGTEERTLFCLETFSGVDIMHFSQFQSESEILLPPGTFFKVKNVYALDTKTTIIHLEEQTPKFSMLS